MPEVLIRKIEWYPVYELAVRGEPTFYSDGYPEVDAETLARWKSVFSEFESVQDELAEMYRARG